MLKNSIKLQNLPVIAIATAGIIHLLIAPIHYSHAPAHGIFFALSGATELLWAAAFWRKPSSRLYYFGLALAGGLVVLWAITRFLVAPFEQEPGMWDLGGLVCKASELVAILALCAMAVQGQIASLRRASLARTAGMALILALAVGAFTYGTGLALQPVLPSLAGSGEHEHAVESGTMQMGDALSGSGESGPTVHAGELQIEQPWTGVASVGSTGGVFMLIKNNGPLPDRLLSVETDIAEAAEIHETTMEADVMKMKRIEGGLEVPAGGQVELKHGSYHIMLINLLHALQAGDHIHLTIIFEQAGSVNVEAVVREP
jgi:copper(I)-binding protein